MMKKWRCTVCNYIHTGEEPPEKCPVCGADKSKFVEISEEEAKTYESKQKGRTQKTAPETRATAPETRATAPETRATATETRAGEGQKAEGQKAETQKAEPQKPESATPSPPPLKTAYEKFEQIVVDHHLHPISVHVPNGVLPVVVLFFFIAAVFAATSLAQAAFYFAVFTILFMPVVLYTGITVWQKKFKGAMTKYFIMKLIAAGIVTISCLLIVIWYFINPQVVLAGAARRGGFLTLNLIMLGAASVAGWLGGKFVFKK